MGWRFLADHLIPMESPPEPLRELAERIRLARGASTREEVARSAGTSTRTLGALERATMASISVKPLVRIAEGLGVSEDELSHWLRLAGHSLNLAKIRALKAEVEQEKSGSRSQDRVQSFLERVDQRMDLEREFHPLLCICYSNPPKTPTEPAISKALVHLVSRGASLALVVPHADPRQSDYRSVGYQYQQLFVAYEDIYTKVYELADSLREEAGDTDWAYNRIKVFGPESESLFLTRPTMGSQTRPFFVKFNEWGSGQRQKFKSHNKYDYMCGQYIVSPSDNQPRFQALDDSSPKFMPTVHSWNSYLDGVFRHWLGPEGLSEHPPEYWSLNFWRVLKTPVELISERNKSNGH